jgi:hypothetical protein
MDGRTKYDSDSYENDKNTNQFRFKYGSSLEISPVGFSSVSKAVQSNFSPSEVQDFRFQSGERESTVVKQVLPIVETDPPLHIYVDIKRLTGVVQLDSVPLKIDPIQVKFSIEASLTQRERKTVQARYEPIGVVVHRGSATGGHYIEYTWDQKTNNWIRHNDTEVTILSPQEYEKTARRDMERGATSILYRRIPLSNFSKSRGGSLEN